MWLKKERKKGSLGWSQGWEEEGECRIAERRPRTNTKAEKHSLRDMKEETHWVIK